MRRVLVLLAAGLVLAVMGLLGSRVLGGLPADPLLVLACVVGAVEGAATGARAGLLLGVVADLLAPPPLGLRAGVYAVLGFLSGRAGSWLELEGAVSQAAFGGISHAVGAALVGFASFLLGRALPPFKEILVGLVQGSVYAGLFAPVLFYAVRPLTSRLGKGAFWRRVLVREG